MEFVSLKLFFLVNMQELNKLSFLHLFAFVQKQLSGFFTVFNQYFLCILNAKLYKKYLSLQRTQITDKM